jgi:hypothetical protein
MHGTTPMDATGSCAMAPSAKPAITAEAWRMVEIRVLATNSWSNHGESHGFIGENFWVSDGFMDV